MEILSCINCAIANAYPDYSIAWVNRKEITDLDRNDKYQDGPNTNSGYTIPFGSQNLVNFLKNKSYVSNNQKYRLMLRYKEREREREYVHILLTFYILLLSYYKRKEDLLLSRKVHPSFLVKGG